MPVWQSLWQDYPGQIARGSLLALLAVLSLATYLWRSNRRLHELTHLNREAQAGLEVTAAAFNSQVGLIVTDKLTRIKRANPAMAALLGYTQADLADQPTATLRGASVPEGTIRTLCKQLQAHGRWQGDLVCRHRSGHDVPCMVTITSIRDSAGRHSGFVGSFIDISEQKKPRPTFANSPILTP